MEFKNAADFAKFNDAYQEYLRRGYSPEASYEKAEKLSGEASDIDELTQKLYERYVSRHGLDPDEALALAKVKAKEAKDKPQEAKKEEKAETPSLNITKWYDDWASNAWKAWSDRFKPVTGFFDDSFFNDFETMLGWNRGEKGKGKGECKCSCKGKGAAPAKKEASVSVPSKPVDKVVEKEVKKVLDTLPEGEVNDANTHVKITKGDPNDYEFRVEHRSPNGSSYSSYTRKYVKS